MTTLTITAALAAVTADQTTLDATVAALSSAPLSGVGAAYAAFTSAYAQLQADQTALATAIAAFTSGVATIESLWSAAFSSAFGTGASG